LITFESVIDIEKENIQNGPRPEKLSFIGFA
jgi:hypothetical protein